MLTERYNQNLVAFPAVRPVLHHDATANYSYYPLVFETEQDLLAAMQALAAHHIQTRRYFYPSLPSVLPYTRQPVLPVVEALAKRVLCLPLYHALTINLDYALEKG